MSNAQSTLIGYSKIPIWAIDNNYPFNPFTLGKGGFHQIYITISKLKLYLAEVETKNQAEAPFPFMSSKGFLSCKDTIHTPSQCRTLVKQPGQSNNEDLTETWIEVHLLGSWVLYNHQF